MKVKENYLEKIPVRNPEIGWNADEEGNVTLEIENKGVFNRIFQKLIKKPRVSFVHLDKTGSFVWSFIDGEKDIESLAKLLEEHFGEKVHPLYERLAKYFQILDSCGFVKWNK